MLPTTANWTTYQRDVSNVTLVDTLTARTWWAVLSTPSMGQPMTHDTGAAIARLGFVGHLRGNGVSSVDRLEAGYKWRAKCAMRALNEASTPIRLMQVQEALAKALGFMNTHGLQQTMHGLRASLAHAQSDPVMWDDKDVAGEVDALVPVYRLCQDFTGTVPLASSESRYLDAVSSRLAHHLTISVEAARRALAVGWAEEESWERITARTPLDQPIDAPLVSFDVDGDPTKRTSKGAFRFSDQGIWIVDQVLLADEYPHHNDAVRQEALATAKRLTETNPEFMTAWLVLAAEQKSKPADRDWRAIDRIFKNGMHAALKLIPAGFKGTLPWEVLGNRDYLRLILGAAQSSMHLHRINVTLRHTRRLLKLCPNDNLGVRFFVPLLHALHDGDTPDTRYAIARSLTDRHIAVGLLNAGLAQAILGDIEGVDSVVEALLRSPNLGQVLFDDDEAWPAEASQREPILHASEHEVLVMLFALAVLPELEIWFHSLMRDQELHRALKIVDRVAAKSGFSTDGDWLSEIDQQLSWLVPEMRRRHPPLKATEAANDPSTK